MILWAVDKQELEPVSAILARLVLINQFPY